MTLSLILILALLAAFVWLHGVEPNWFHLRRETVRVKKPIGNPLTILHLSDLHCTGRRVWVERFFSRLSRLEFDWVFVTGDLIDSEAGIQHCIANLKKLKPKKGIYAVLGNHDYRAYPLLDQLFRLATGRDLGFERPEVTEKLKKALAEAGIPLLANQNVRIALDNGREAVVIGIDDPVTGHADLKKAFHGIENGVLHLALLHSPAPFPSLERRGIDVAFAGHTHGGQIRLPGMGPLPLVYRLEPIIDSTHRFGFAGIVSRGMGAVPSNRLRFFCRPEAVLVRIEGL